MQVVTLGERGMAVIGDDPDAVFLPARARQVFDVTGAGDTVIATLAAGLAGDGRRRGGGTANLAAGIVVGRIVSRRSRRRAELSCTNGRGEGPPREEARRSLRGSRTRRASS